MDLPYKECILIFQRKNGVVLLHLPNAKNVWDGERDTGLICNNFFRYKWVGREGEEGKAP